MRVGAVHDGSEGCAVLDLGEQSVCRDGVGVDPVVTVFPFMGGVLCNPVSLACSRAGAPVLWEARGFCPAFPGLNWCPGTQCPGEGCSPRPAFVCNALARSD